MAEFSREQESLPSPGILAVVTGWDSTTPRVSKMDSVVLLDVIRSSIAAKASLAGGIPAAIDDADELSPGRTGMGKGRRRGG